ncbi:MAG: TonB-dependent receptor [Acidobacteriaceae bacterium]
MRRICTIALVLVGMFSTATVVAQTATTSLRGVVKDSSGALVPNATITLSDKSNGTSYHATSNSAGYYIFPVITPATYTVEATSMGFAPQNRTAELLVSQPATINFTMSVKSSNVTVNVSAATEDLNLTDATEGNAVGNQTIEALPMDARNPISLLTLQPGVLYLGPSNTDSRTGSVAGGRSDQGNVTLDGLDDNDQLQGTAFTGVLRSTIDSTEEFRVVTSNGTAEAGRSSGAQVNLITKSGTNHYHGSLYEYYRPTNTVSNDFFNKNSEILSDEPNIPQKYIQNVFGGSIGAPIIKDKLFYFFNYEGTRIGTDTVIGATVPTASFMNGSLGYQDANGNTDYLSSAQVTALDEPCTQANNFFNGATVCPNGPGPNQAVLAYYAKVPTATTTILGDGINSGGYYFVSPTPSTLNTNILKIDYVPNSKNHFFVRGNLQKDTASGAENLPGQPASTEYDDNTKGLAAGYTWIPNSNLVNDLRYGFIRQGYQYGGVGSGEYVYVYGLTQPTAQTRNSFVHVPVNTITDTFNWTKGSHTIAIGGNWRHITDETGTDANSFGGAETNWEYAEQGDLPAPSNIASSFYSSEWAQAYADLMGVIPEVTGVYNYAITSPTQGTAQAEGTYLYRDYRINEYEYFLQDTWHARPNLTITYGLRHTLLQTPYEIHGQEIAPTINTDAWYKQREIAALQGQIYEPDIYLAPAGKANHAPGLYPKQKDNIAPHLGIVFSPDPRTSIRASAGIYYDHYGEALAQNFANEGSLGLSAGITNGADELGFENSPRFTAYNALPNISLPPVSPTISFPYEAPADGFEITWGLDNRLKTPYSEGYNLSIQHELPKGFTFEEAYVGRLGRHLIQQIDMAENVDYTDPQGGGDYFSNARKLSAATDAAPFGYLVDYNCPVNPNLPAGQSQGCYQKTANVQPIPYFEDVFPYMKNLDYPGESATQAVFNNAWAPERYTNGETFSIVELDFAPYGFYPGIPTQSRFLSSQFSSLYADDTIGTSSYNALQFTLRHPPSHGLTVDVNYTFSKSIDIGSETERTSQEGNTDDAYTNFAIQNTWNPKLNKGVSDFDTHSLVSADWVYALPVGRGMKYLAGGHPVLDALIGGWQFAGLARWTSGLPFSLEGPAYPSNYNNPSMTFNVGNVRTHRNFSNGYYHAFDSTTVHNVNNGIYYGQYIRLPYAGEAGQRNNYRGDGYFDIDSSLTKTWGLWHNVKLKFAAEAYNITNTDRFDVSLAGLNARSASLNLGNYTGNLSEYRRMQFGLRVEF